jgi:hypothetical protein
VSTSGRPLPSFTYASTSGTRPRLASDSGAVDAMRHPSLVPSLSRGNAPFGSCSSSCIHPRSAGSDPPPSRLSAAGQDCGEPSRTPGRTVGKRVGGNPSRVRISYPPHPPTWADVGPDRIAVGPYVVRGLQFGLQLPEPLTLPHPIRALISALAGGPAPHMHGRDRGLGQAVDHLDRTAAKLEKHMRARGDFPPGRTQVPEQDDPRRTSWASKSTSRPDDESCGEPVSYLTAESRAGSRSPWIVRP